MLNPVLLWFLPLALVPLVLHLLVRRRVRTVELPTLRFLLGQSAQQRRRFWLIELLVMILRTLAVAMLVLMVSRPVVDRFGFLFGGSSGQDVAIIVDSGAAMGISSGGTTSLERGKTSITAVLDRMGSGDYVSVIRAAGRPEVVVGGFARQRDTLQAAVDALDTSATSGDLARAIELAMSTDARGPRTLYIVTDRRQQAWSGVAGVGALASARPSPRIVVLDVASPDRPDNCSILGDPPQDLRPVAGLPVQLTAVIANAAADQTRDAMLTLSLDDKQVTQENISIPPSQRITRTFTVTPSRPGVIRGRFELTADAFPDDDSYLFCLNVDPKLVVLVITSPAADNSSTLTNRFVPAALKAPLTAQRGLVAAARDIAQALDIRTISVDQIVNDQLEPADVVILDAAVLDEDKARQLRRYVETGGGLMVLPGPNVDRNIYQRFLLRDTGIAMQNPAGKADDESRFAPIVNLDVAHPVLRVFDAPGSERDANYFATVRLFRYFPLTGEEKSTATRLMALPDGRAAMMEATLGRGRLLVTAFASDPKWSNLPLKPEFVPLLLRSVAHLRKTSRAAIVGEPRAGQPLVLSMPGQWSDAIVQATDPAGRPMTLDVTRSADDLLAAVPVAQMQQRGYYQFDITPRGHMATTGVQLGAAVNIDAKALDLATIDEAAIRGALAPIDPLFVSGAPGESTIGERLSERRETWRWLIWVMFAVVGVEFVLATLLPTRDATPGMARPRGPIGRLADQSIGVLRRAGLLESVRGIDG